VRAGKSPVRLRELKLGAIFISYRRSDSQGEAGRLFDDLVKHFGERMVFMDVAAIEAGRDFRRAIEESVAKCGVLLVVIGPEWLNAKDKGGVYRLNDPTDFVRIETASALKRDIAVIPVLVRGAEMPRAEQLPEDLKELAYRNCAELTHARWRSDIQLLIEALRRLVGDANQIEATTPSNEAAASPATPRQEAAASPKLENESSARIDPAVIQRVSRELALHIGPIAEMVTRRAASRCSSVDDLYLKVAEEIDSPDEREKFLLERARILSTPHATGTPTVPSNTPGASVSRPLSEGIDARLKTTAPAAAIRRSSPWKYWLLISGGLIFVILMFVVAKHLAAPKGAGSDRTVRASPQETQTPESAPLQTGTPSTETAAKSDQPVKSPVTRATGESELNPPQRVHVSQEVSMSLLVDKVVPVYPPVAQQARVQGAVVLEANISKDGTVEALKAISGHPLLVPAAIEAVKQWRYKPYVVNGEPLAVNTQITVNFTLSGG